LLSIWASSRRTASFIAVSILFICSCDNPNPSRETVNRGSLDVLGTIGELIVKKDVINNKLTKIKQFPKNELKFQIQLK
jgi:hypothetical protein